jgi:O-antigen/teichoic acid export membrane protein
MHLKPEELIPAGIAFVVAWFVLRAIYRRLRKVKPLAWFYVALAVCLVVIVVGGSL